MTMAMPTLPASTAVSRVRSVVLSRSPAVTPRDAAMKPDTASATSMMRAHHHSDGRDSWRHRLCSQGAIHPGNFPAQLPVGPRPPVGSGEPGVAVPGLGRWCGTRRRAVDHRPGLDHLRDLRTGQGGGASPWLHWPAGLSPAAGHRRRHRRGADVSAARGPGQHRSGRRPLPAGDRGPGAPCWGQGTTHGAGRQRLLCPRPGRRLPRDGCPLLHHHPPTRPPQGVD